MLNNKIFLTILKEIWLELEQSALIGQAHYVQVQQEKIKIDHSIHLFFAICYITKKVKLP